MRTSRLVAVLGLAVSFLVLAPGPSYACSCARQSTAGYVDMADVVVRGTVESERGPAAGRVRSSLDPVTYTVSVDEVYKGSAGPALEVRSAADGASCGLEGIRVGREYVVFASEEQHPKPRGRLWASLCGGTAPASPSLVAEVDAAAPGGGEGAGPPPPEEAADEPTTGWRIDDTVPEPSVWPWVAGLVGVGALAGGAGVLLRSRRRARAH